MAFYTRLFDESMITNTQTLENTPSGEVLSVNFTLANQSFMAINGGPHFTFNPSISFMVMCETEAEVKRLWNTLIADGEALMPLDVYPFSKQYGWLKDRFGLTWQILLTESPITQKIIPNLLFSKEVTGKAKEAINNYTDLFPESSITELHHYQSVEDINPSDKLKFGQFNLSKMEFFVMDNAKEVAYTFNEALSLLVLCKTQEEIDYYWEKLSADSDAEQCGWLKDRFGVSWQIVPEKMNELLTTGTKEQITQTTQAFLKMKKINSTELEKAWQDAK